MALLKSSGYAMSFLGPLCPARASSSSSSDSSSSSSDSTSSPRELRAGSSSSWRRALTDPSPHKTSPSPPPSRAQVSTNWRTSGGVQGPSPSPGPVCVIGRVVKLPEEFEVPVTSCFHKQVVGMAPWNHPVVITGLWKDPFTGEQLVRFRSCTSWGGQGLKIKPTYHHHYFMAADQTTLESGSFNKSTYVNCSPGAEFIIEFKHLQIWTGTIIQFSREALRSFNKNDLPRRDSGYNSH